jgi:hypothetical protein
VYLFVSWTGLLFIVGGLDDADFVVPETFISEISSIKEAGLKSVKSFISPNALTQESGELDTEMTKSIHHTQKEQVTTTLLVKRSTNMNKNNKNNENNPNNPNNKIPTQDSLEEQNGVITRPGIGNYQLPVLTVSPHHLAMHICMY